MANSTGNVPPFPYPDQPATATLTDTTNGNVYAFPFNINSLNWNYQMNTQSYSTMGGRVTQMLSVQITTMTAQGAAGSRKAIIDLYKPQDFKNITKITYLDNEALQEKNYLFDNFTFNFIDSSDNFFDTSYR